jgi:hypothetical protein
MVRSPDGWSIDFPDDGSAARLRRALDTWEKIVNFTQDEWFPSRLPFGKFKGRLYQEAREDAELQSWLEWRAKSTNERSSAMGRWYLDQLENGAGLEDAALLDLEIQEHAGDAAAGLVVSQQPEMEVGELVLAVRSMEIEDFDMSVGVINPINECEFASDGDLKFSAGVVKVSGVGHCEGIVADVCNGAAKDFPVSRWQPFEKFDDFNRDQEPIVHGLGFEALIEFCERSPVFRLVVVDLSSHSGSIVS